MLRFILIGGPISNGPIPECSKNFEISAHWKWALQLIFCLVIILWGLPLCAESPQERHESIKKNYFRLKNIDPKVQDIAAWSDVISSYRDFIESKAALNDKVYFEFGNLLQEFGQITKNDQIVDEANQTYEFLIEHFPSSQISDDAMLKSAEILKYQGASYVALSEFYQELIDKFPQSDSAEIARMRLNSIKNPDSFSSEEPAELNNSQDQSDSKQLPLIVLDPGHGGEDFGTENNFGLLEKDVVLSIALEAERIIRSRGKAQVILTRRNDKFVPLPDRIAVANENKAVLFLSLHNNASPKHNQSGITAYVIDDSSDEASKLLAERENKSAGSSNSSDLDFIVSDLVQSSKHPKSILLAETIDKAVLGSVRSNWQGANSLGVKRAPFYVLVGAHMPCALIELFFLDHEKDGDQLSDPEIRKAIANGIAKGIEIFLERSRG